MEQDLHLGEMLKARLAEKQQPIQLNLFDDGDYVVHEVKHAMNLSLDAVYKLRDSNPHAFYRIKQMNAKRRSDNCRTWKLISAKSILQSRLSIS
jgi:hypothetical protein